MQLIQHGNNETEIQLNNGNALFFSYSTLVLVKLYNGVICQTTKHYSATTSKHIKKMIERWGEPEEMMPQEELENLVTLRFI